MTSEEIILKLGLDGSSLAQGLRSGKEKVREFAQETKAQFSEAFGAFLPALGLAAVIEGLHKLGEAAKHVQIQSEALGVSNGFIQFLQNAGTLSQVASENVEKMFSKWAAGLPVGTDIEQSFQAMLDIINKIPDATLQAAAAQEMLGKEASKYWQVLIKIAQASEEAKKMSIMSDEDIKNASRFEEIWTQSNNKLVVGVAKAVTAFARLRKAISEVSEERGGLYGKFNDVGDFTGAVASQTRKDIYATKIKEAEDYAIKLGLKKEADKKAQKESDAEGQEGYIQKLGDSVMQHGTSGEKLDVLRGRLGDIMKQLEGVRERSKEWWGYLGKGRDVQAEIYDLTQKQADEADKMANKKREETEKLTKDLGRVDLEIDRTQDEMSKGLEPTEKELIGSGSWVDTGRMAGSRQHGRRFVQSAGSIKASEIQERENIIKAANSGFYGLDKKTNEGIVKEQEDAIGRVREWMDEHGIHTQEQDHAKEIADKLEALTEDRAAITVKLRNAR